METSTEAINRLDRRLFGLDGESGVIGRLEAADKKNEDLIDERHKENRTAIGNLDKKFDRAKWLLIGFVAAWGCLTGTGIASADHIFRVIGWLK